MSGSAACALASLLLSAQNASGSVSILGRKAYSCMGLGDSVPSKSYTSAMVFLSNLGVGARRLSAPALAPASSSSPSLMRLLCARSTIWHPSRDLGATIGRFGGAAKAARAVRGGQQATE